MDENSFPQQPIADQSPIHTSSTYSPHKVLIGILVITIIALGGYVIYLNGKIVSQQNLSSVTDNSMIENTTSGDDSSIDQSESQQENNTDSEPMEHFSDPRVNGIEFNYDPSMWTVQAYTSKDDTSEITRHSGSGVLLTADHGVLFINYIYPYPMGGAVNLMSDETHTQLKGNLHRIRSWLQSDEYFKDYYSYGIAESRLTFFDQEPDKKEFILSNCGKSTPLYLSDSDCISIRNGTVIGYFNEPTFSYSFEFSKNSSLEDLFGTWNTDHYPELEKIPVKFVYKGSQPEAADVIVEQVVSE